MSEELHVLLSSEEERENLPPVRGKVTDAWVYWWEDGKELLLRADAEGHVLEHVSGPENDKTSYQKLFVVKSGTRAEVAFSRGDDIIRRVDVEPQLKGLQVEKSLSASLASIGPIFVPKSGKKTVKVLPMAEVRLGPGIKPLKGDEVSLVADFPEPWRVSIAAERKAALVDKTWHPGSQSFTDVANTPNRGKRRTAVRKVSHVSDLMSEVLKRPPDSIRRLNVFTHANPGLISLSGRMQGQDVILNGTAFVEDQPIAGGLDGRVVVWWNEDAVGRMQRDEMRRRFTAHGEILLFLCNGGIGRGLSLAIDLAKCLNVRILAYSEPIGYYVEFPRGGVDRNLTSLGLVSDDQFEGAKKSGRVAPGYPFVMEAPDDIPKGHHVEPDRKVDKPKRPSS